MKSLKLILILGLIIPFLRVVGLGSYYFQTPNTPEIPEKEKTSYELHHEIEDKNKPPEQTVQKTWTNGNVTIDYAVRVENGVEASPPPRVVEAIGKAIDENDKAKFLQEYYNSTFYKLRHQYDENIKKHNPYYIKSYIDQAFTCETYHDLAYKYKMDKLFDEQGNFLDAENYVYQRAFNECIDVKHQEAVDKVNQELDEVNATSVEEVNVND